MNILTTVPFVARIIRGILFTLLLSTFSGEAVRAESLVYYLVDRSISMRNSELVAPVVESIETHSASLNAETDVLLQFFASRAGEVSRWDGFSPTNRAEFLASVRRELRPTGSTRLFDTVAEAVDRIRSVASQYDQISFIIFSDGDDNASSDRAQDKRWSLITPELLKLADANAYARTYLIALPGQNPKPEDFTEFETSGIIYTSVPNNEPVIIPVAAPEVGFTASPTRAEPGQPIRFVATNTGGQAARLIWDFGDGPPAEAGAEVEHAYGREGTFDVSVRAISEAGEDIAERIQYIQVAYSVPLKAVISVFPERPVSGQAVLLSSESTGNPDRLEWSINGAVVGMGASYNWEMPTAGKHEVGLRIFKGERPASTSRTIEIEPPPPSAAFDFPDGDQYDFGSTVRAVAQAVGPGLKHTWTIGGAESRSGAAIEWKADQAGLIEFVHRVEDARGAISVAAEKVLVREPVVVLPDAGFSLEPLPAEVGATLKLTAKSVAAELSHEWFAGGKRIGEGSVIRFVPEEAGNLAVRHVIRMGEFSEESESEIYVKEPDLVQARFKASTDSGSYPLTVDFTDKSKGKIVAYNWDFGDGASSAEANPVHTYEAPGAYGVTLEVTNTGGVVSRSPETLLITVKKPLPGWLKWAVVGVVAAIILLFLLLKMKPKPISGKLRYEYDGQSQLTDLEGSRLNLAELGIPGWTPAFKYTIENKGGIWLLQDGVPLEELDRRKEFTVESVRFKYLP